MNFQLSKKVTLEVGDKVRVTAGPYYLSKDGTKINMGEKGIGTFTGVDPQGKGIYIQFDRVRASRFVYIGVEEPSKNGTILRSHKVTKIRKKG